MLLGDEIRLKEFYETWGFMRDHERANMLPIMAAGLTSIRWALKVDNPALNEDLVNETLPSMASLSTFLPSSLNLKTSTTSTQNQNDDPSIAEETSGDQPVSISTKPKVKKKKRTRAAAQIVNFPEASAEVKMISVLFIAYDGDFDYWASSQADLILNYFLPNSPFPPSPAGRLNN